MPGVPTTKDDVLKLVINTSFNWESDGVINIGSIAKLLETTKYQVRKQLNVLLEEGLIVPATRRGGFDEYSYIPYPPLKGYKITTKAMELPLYAELKAIEEKILSECFGFSSANIV